MCRASRGDADGRSEMALITIERVWSHVQGEILASTARYLDAEGAVRSGKTTVALHKIFQSALDNPGIQWLVARWTDDSLKATVKPIWRTICQEAGLSPKWNADEHYDEFPNGSRVYLRGLKSSEPGSNPYIKFRGLTLAGIYVDQAEEIPHDIYVELKSRLSQKGYPHQLIITPNPPQEDHWIAREFPETNDRPFHQYIRLRIHDNAANLDQTTIPDLEREYPPGHTKRRPLLEGLRGLNVAGEPVYGHVFQRDTHLREIEPYPSVEVIEAIDFGKHHPCILWVQLTPYGGLSMLGGVMGQDLFLPDFLPIVMDYRSRWFPGVDDFVTCCDPAGTHDNSQGSPIRGLDILQDHGIHPRWRDDSNAPNIRRVAVETIADYLRRLDARGEPAFSVDARRWVVVGDQPRESPFALQALEAGYVWDPNQRSVGNKSISVPKKDGWFEHVMNCLEYAVLNFGRAYKTPEQVERLKVKEQQRRLRLAQRDVDPYDLDHQSRLRGRSRRGGVL